MIRFLRNGKFENTQEYQDCLALTNEILGGLPYTPLEYIKSSGTQYIDTGVQVKSNYKVEIKFNQTGTSAKFQAVFGGRTNYNNNQLSYYNRAEFNDTQKILAYKYETKPFLSSSYLNIDTTVIFDKNIFSITDGVNSETITKDDYTFSDPHTIWLFACNNNNSADYASTMKLYYCKIYDYDTNSLIRDFIPVKRKGDNEICLYDKVSEQFFTNQGTGTFEAGPEIKDYVELEYIQSTGIQYIDTGILMKGNYDFRIKLQYTTAANDLFGARSSQIHYFLENYNGGVVGYGSQEYYFSSIMSLGTNVREFHYDKNNVYYVDNGNEIPIKAFNSENFTTVSSLILFARHWNDTISHRASGKIFFAKIKDENGTLLRDFIPVKRKSDDEICLYDKVSNQYFTNQGTGTFEAGPEVE